MANSELDHLITMINQIADNVAKGDSTVDASANVADHVSRFWARSMKDQIIEYAQRDGQLLQPCAREAVYLLS